MRGIMNQVNKGETVIELQNWSRRVMEAASKLRWDSQLALSAELGAPQNPLPLSEKQRREAGSQYSTAELCKTEPDGHEILADEQNLAGPFPLTGCYASLRPLYLRRKTAEDFSAREWKDALCSDYRRLVIQNHFHKCTKSCFKKQVDGIGYTCCHLVIWVLL